MAQLYPHTEEMTITEKAMVEEWDILSDVFWKYQDSSIHSDVHKALDASHKMRSIMNHIHKHGSLEARKYYLATLQASNKRNESYRSKI